MKKISIILVLAVSLLFYGSVTATAASPNQITRSYLDLLTAFQVVWMHDQERLSMDLNQAFYDEWGDPLFAQIAASKPRYMERLMDLIDWYDIRVYGEISNLSHAYTDERHAEAFDDLVARGLGSEETAWLAAAYVEEWNIFEYSHDIKALNQEECYLCQGTYLLAVAYEDLLAASYENFVNLVSRVNDYQAQLLSQAEVDAIISQTPGPVDESFVINGGLTDVWYDPSTSGQGFFIAVYEKSASVFVSWMTFDTDLPASGVTAHVGDAGQRWLTAQGTFNGDVAELVVYSASGGIFDASQPIPTLQPIGSMLMEFENCNSGTLSFDLPEPGMSGSIDVQRLAPDNAVICKVMTPLVP